MFPDSNFELLRREMIWGVKMPSLISANLTSSISVDGGWLLGLRDCGNLWTF